MTFLMSEKTHADSISSLGGIGIFCRAGVELAAYI